MSLPFITTFILVFLVGSFGTMIIGNNKPYGQLHISDDSFLTLVGTVSGLLNGLSGIVWGPIQSKIHFKYNIYAILAINTVCAFLYPSLSDSKPLYFLLTASSIFCYGGKKLKFYFYFLALLTNFFDKSRFIHCVSNCCSGNIRQELWDQNAWNFLPRLNSSKSFFVSAIRKCK